VALYRELGVERRDVEGRKRAFLRNYELFDAPHVAFIGMHKSFGSSVVVDVGIYLGQLMLALTAHGIASCPMGSLRNYPDVVRRELDVPEDIGILVGLCFGYEDPDAPANRTRTTREALDANVVFHE
ncbi:MAG: nitroreductase family protein, partial [Myxococcales bacterium]|nr:nitroreductase family protein [Myxococcales bacterium]